MNIKNIQNVSKVYGQSKSAAKPASPLSPGSSQRPDEVVLSSQAQEFSQILKNIRDLPEVREAKVKEFANRIAAGNYKVSAEDIANQIIAYSKIGR
ncbi:MAG TPA: flagellar biosynthesis anti-sigma factor FlgM [Methylomusa anaerophila]|uniref:Negative regulator of flagellin synthesis n=1 Tax=Methylomusa anaerophila TaxID=1930071 RepID=A0A348AKU1_9FIRM|nr:flagellar biosynthesis anti-sigma factor FlgM [Methylomusa anaerophila]BBB91689.1 anti-sigma-28 factor, FlgM [Methylomusa anaerophila]HML88577.1 flagellar biosynthesis anti-sigma factor FlgM [Methylomusa anaerophila]